MSDNPPKSENPNAPNTNSALAGVVPIEDFAHFVKARLFTVNDPQDQAIAFAADGSIEFGNVPNGTKTTQSHIPDELPYDVLASDYPEAKDERGNFKNAILISEAEGKKTYQLKDKTLVTKTGDDSGYILYPPNLTEDKDGYQKIETFGPKTQDVISARVKATPYGWSYKYDSPAGQTAIVVKDRKTGEIVSAKNKEGGYTVHHFGPDSAKDNYDEYHRADGTIMDLSPIRSKRIDNLPELPKDVFGLAEPKQLSTKEIKEMQNKVNKDKTLVEITSALSNPRPLGTTKGDEMIVGYNKDELVLIQDTSNNLYVKLNQEQTKQAGLDKPGWYFKDQDKDKFVKMPYENYRFSKYDQAFLAQFSNDRAKVTTTTGEESEGKINLSGTFVPTDSSGNVKMIWRADNSKVMPHYDTNESGQQILTSVAEIKPDGTEQTWHREKEGLVLRDEKGEKIGQNFAMQTNGNITFTDIKDGETIIRGDGTVLQTKDGQPIFAFDEEGRFKQVGAYSFEYSGGNDQPCKVTSSAAKEYPPASYQGKNFSFVDELQADGKTWTRSLRDEKGASYLNRYWLPGYSLEGQHILSANGDYRRPDVIVKDATDKLVDRTTLADGSEKQTILGDILLDGLNDSQRRFLYLVNNARQQANLRPVTYDRSMEAGAMYNSQLMATDGVNMSAHLAPDSANHFEIAFDAQPDADTAFIGFMNSAGHREHIMDPGMQTIAIGIYGNSWTARFWKPPPPGYYYV